MLKCTPQIPRTSLKIYFWIEKLVDLEVVDLVFAGPFIRGSLAELHHAALARSPIFLTIKPALPPDDRFDQHWIELMLRRDRQNEFIILLETRRADPFVKAIERIARPEREI